MVGQVQLKINNIILTDSPARFCVELNVQLIGKKSSISCEVERSKSIVAFLLSGDITEIFQMRKPRLLYE